MWPWNNEPSQKKQLQQISADVKKILAIVQALTAIDPLLRAEIAALGVKSDTLKNAVNQNQ